MTFSPGDLLSAASARSAVMKSPAMNSPLPSMKKQRSASPSHAMPMSGLLGDDALHDVAAVFLDERVGFVIRETAIDLETESRRAARKLLEQPRRDETGHSRCRHQRTTLKGLITEGSMKLSTHVT
jgi:hypothetical protein